MMIIIITMFRFNPSSPNKGDSQRVNDVAGVGCLGYWRVPEVGRPHSRSGDQTYRLGCVDEVPLRGFPVSIPYCGLKHKVQGRTAPAVRPVTGTRLTYGYKTSLSTQRS